MDVGTFIILVVIPPLNFAHSVHVSGTIEQNKTFFYRKLPVTPSVHATINYVISYKQRSIVHKSQYPLMGIYTEFPKVNIDRHCSKIRYAQLRNENLHPHLRLHRPYRTTSCEISEGDDTVNCRGRVHVQDYKPRNFYLTFGFHCHWRPGNSLQGLIYNISFTKQSNETNSCILSYRSPNFLTKCNMFCNETSLPNLIGTEFFKMEEIRKLVRMLKTYQALAFLNRPCYQHTWEVLCHILLPKCDPVTKQVIHPCREMCWDFINGCWENIVSLTKKLGKDLDYNNVYSIDLSTFGDCDYLPPLQGSIRCFYKPVTCDSPPYVTDGTKTLKTTQKDVYQLHDVVHYTCDNSIFEMTGNDSIKCQYSGRWSHPPPKCEVVKQMKKSWMGLAYIALPIFLILFLVILLVGITQKRKTVKDSPSLPLLIRNREFDAFVIYHFDTDNNFVVNTLIPELKEARDLRLHIHSQDFQPGRNIEENIEEAIKSSNNAVILVSTGFINSRWCMNEFSHCYIEHVEDPSFKLFVIMMQPMKELPQLPLNMKELVTEQTYLERIDPKLFTKLARCLTPENDADVTDTD